MPFYKILIPIIAGLMIYKGLMSLIKWNIDWRELLFSTLFWWFLTAIAIYPHIIDFLARITWISDSVRAFFAMIIMLLSFVILKLILSIEKIERNITQTIRYNALEKFKE